MRVRVLFFGMLKDLAERSGEEIELPEGADLGAVFDLYAARYPKIRALAASIVPARNQQFAERYQGRGWVQPKNSARVRRASGTGNTLGIC